MSEYQSTQKSNIKRCFGYTENTASARLLKLVQENPNSWYSIKEAAALTFSEYSPTDNAIYNGRRCGVLQVRKRPSTEKRGRFIIECAFLANPVPYQKPHKADAKKPGRKPGISRAASPIKTNNKRTRERLETRQRMNFANPIKRWGDNTPAVPGEHTKVTKAPTYAGLGNRAYSDPASAPSIFRSIPLGATLEAA